MTTRVAGVPDTDPAPVGASERSSAALGRRLAALDPRLGFTIGPPSGPGWWRLDHLDESILGGWIDEKSAQVGGHRGIVVGWTAEALARRVVAPAVAAWATEGRLPDLRPENVAVRRGDGGIIDRTAFLSDPLVAGDAPHGHDLPSRAAAGLVATLEPVFATICRTGRFGRRGLWGCAADSAAGAIVRLVRTGGISAADGLRAWALVDAVFDLVAARGQPTEARPRVSAGRWAGIESLVLVRSVCCLWCATDDGVACPEPDRYCTSCPRLGDADRAARLSVQMQAAS